MDRLKLRKIVALSATATVSLSAVTIALIQEPGASGQRLSASKSVLTDGADTVKTSDTSPDTAPIQIASDRDR